MASDPASFAIHATAVAVGHRALVIRGPSRAGKSTLALQLIAASTCAVPIMLVGDDRVIVSRAPVGLVAAPHERIAGLIEKRGEGILAMPFCTGVPIFGLVDLASPAGSRHGCASTCDLAGQNFPALLFVSESRVGSRATRVLEWMAATSVAHCGLKCGLNLSHA